MKNRVGFDNKSAGMESRMPEMVSRTVSPSVPGFFKASALAALHIITLLIGLVVILLVAAGF
jgi:hypothetical protein